jgi:NAD(P)H dehydrogenase (quinone)
VLYYPGYDVLPPFLVYRTGRMDEERYAQTRDTLGARLDALAQTEPIAFRKQNGGAYEIPALTLREDVAPERTGFAAHVA